MDNAGTRENRAESGNGKTPTGSHPDTELSPGSSNDQTSGTNQSGTGPGSGSEESCYGTL